MLVELGIALREVLHGLSKPVVLVRAVGTHNTARHYVLEQLVSRFFERRWTCDWTTLSRLRLSHAPGGGRKVSTTNVMRRRVASQTLETIFAQTVPPVSRTPRKSSKRPVSISGL